jgi:RecA-family ATPase
LLAYVAICVATDKPVIGRKVRQTGVLWIDLDNGRRRTDERFAALSRELNVPDDAPLYYVSLPDPFLDGANAQDIEHLAELVERLSIGLIVIDNLGLVSPSSDENSDAMIVVMSNFRRLCERTQAVMVLIHHQRKGNTSGRAGDALRGHSSIEGAVDLALHVSRHNESGNIITVASTKSRDTDVVPFSVAFYYEHKPDSEELLKAGFRPYEIEDLTSDRAIEGAILTIVHDQPNLTQKQVVSLVRSKLRAGVNRIRKIYNEMRASGQFKCTRA